MKIAVAPRIGVGGSLFTVEQWKSIGDVLQADAKNFAFLNGERENCD